MLFPTLKDTFDVGVMRLLADGEAVVSFKKRPVIQTHWRAATLSCQLGASGRKRCPNA